MRRQALRPSRAARALTRCDGWPDDEPGIVGGRDGAHGKAGGMVSGQLSFAQGEELAVVHGGFVAMVSVGDIEALGEQRCEPAHLVGPAFDDPEAMTVTVDADAGGVGSAAGDGFVEALTELTGAVAGDHEDRAELRACRFEESEAVVLDPTW